jgi:hypothetical protein
LKVLRMAESSRIAMIITKMIVQPVNGKEGQLFEISMSTSLIISFDSIEFNVDLSLFICNIHRWRSSSK